MFATLSSMTLFQFSHSFGKYSLNFHGINVDMGGFYEIGTILFNLIYLHPILIWRRSPTIIRQRVLSNVGFGDDRIGEGSIVYKVLYLMFKAEPIVGLVARFLVVVAIFIKVPSWGYGVKHGCRIQGLEESLGG